MAISNEKIVAPVSFYNAQKTLSSTAQDEGTLCTRDNINKWARYKPETAVTGLVTFGISPITLQQRNLNGYGIDFIEECQ